MHRRGQTLLLAVLIVAMLTTIGLIAIGSVLTNRTFIQSARQQAIARNIAEAGIEYALYQFNKNNFANSSPLYTAFGGGEYSYTVTAIDAANKRIDATGYYPNHTSPRATRHLRVRGSISTAAIAFNYGVQVGAGGVFLNNGTSINGNLYANGTICGTNDSSGASCDGHTNGIIAGDVYVAAGANVDQQKTQYLGDQNVGDTASNEALAQNFKPGSTDTLTQVALYIRTVGNPGDATVRIHTDNSGSPATTAIGSGTLYASQVTSSYAWVTIPLSTPVAVTASPTTYWVSLDAGAAGTDYFIWGKNSNSGCGNGCGKTSTAWNSGSWNAISGDLEFKTYMAGSPTKLDSISSVTGNAHANTISNSVVTLDAFYQTIASTTVSGSACPNVHCHANTPDPAIQSFPVSNGNIADWETSAEAGGVLSGDRTFSSNAALGPTKITGKLTINGGATVTIGGPVWVVGDIEISGNNTVVKLSDVSGGTSSVIIADDPANAATKGKIVVTNGSGLDIRGSGTSGSYIMLLSTFSGSPPANAIDVGNNATGAIFYATAGRIAISNGVSLKEVTGYQMYLKNNASVTYESGLANAQFTTGPGAVWALRRDTWQELKP